MSKIIKLSNIPNSITVFRTFLIVPLVFMIYQKDSLAFLLIWIVIKILDGVDGTLARKYRWTSELGSKLDSYSDIISDVTAFAGFYLIKPELFVNYKYYWITSICSLVVAWSYGFLKTGKLYIFHLYSNKTFGLFFLTFLVVGLLYQPINWIMMMATIFGLIAGTEQIAIINRYGKNINLEIQEYFVPKLKKHFK